MSSTIASFFIFFILNFYFFLKSGGYHLNITKYSRFPQVQRTNLTHIFSISKTFCFFGKKTMVLLKPLINNPTATVIAVNENGGFYCYGKRYSLSNKTRVACLKSSFFFEEQVRFCTKRKAPGLCYEGLTQVCWSRN